VNPPGTGSISPDCSGECTFECMSIVDLTAEESSGVFTGWTNCDSDSYNFCTMTMNYTKYINANFDGSCDPPMQPVKLIGTSTDYYSSIQEAYDAAVDQNTIQIQDGVYQEDLIIDLNKTVIIENGYNCIYTAISGGTTVVGNLSISDGELIINKGTISVQTDQNKSCALDAAVSCQVDSDCDIFVPGDCTSGKPSSRVCQALSHIDMIGQSCREDIDCYTYTSVGPCI